MFIVQINKIGYANENLDAVETTTESIHGTFEDKEKAMKFIMKQGFTKHTGRSDRRGNITDAMHDKWLRNGPDGCRSAEAHEVMPK